MGWPKGKPRKKKGAPLVPPAPTPPTQNNSRTIKAIMHEILDLPAKSDDPTTPTRRVLLALKIIDELALAKGDMRAIDRILDYDSGKVPDVVRVDGPRYDLSGLSTAELEQLAHIRSKVKVLDDGGSS